MKVTLEVDSEVPGRLRRTLAGVRDVELVDGHGTRVRVDGRDRPLVLLPRPQATITDDGTAARDLARRVPRGTVGLVVGSSIPQRERDALEAAGLSWCDGRGALHVSWPGVLVHIDHAGRRPARSSPTTDTSGLGPAGIRAVQVLLRDTEGEWTVSRLAHEGAISVGHAHKVFRTLEQNRLLATHGRGPQQRRVITDRRGALDWLAAIDGSRRRPDAAATYLYARTGEQLLSRLAERARDAGVPYAVTAAAASQLLGAPVLTNIVVTQVRVAVPRAADAVFALGLEHLEAEDAGRGMNLELWSDTGELGTFGATDVDGIRVAPAIRVWLDMARQGGRNADAAQLFREQVLERA